MLLVVALFGALLVWAVPREDGAALDASKRVTAGVVNQDTSEYVQLLIGYFFEHPVISSYASFVEGEEEEIRARFEAGELDMYMVVPADFAESMMHLEHLPMQAVISTEHTSKALLMKNLLQSYAEYISAVEVNCVALYDMALELGLPKADARRANEDISMDLILMALSKDDFFERIPVMDYAAIQLVPYYLYEVCYLAAAFLALLAGVRFQKEHHAGIYRRLAAMGHSTLSVLVEKQLFYMLNFTAVYFVVWRLLALTGVQIKGQVFVYFCLHSYLMLALMLCLGAGFQKLQNYLLASNMVVLLGAVLGGGLIPVMYLPEQMERIAKLLPNYWFLKLTFAVKSNAAGNSYYIACILLLSGAFVLLLTGAALYRKREGRVYENA